MQNFWEKPSLTEALLLIAAWFVLCTSLSHLYFFDWAYDLLFFRSEKNANGIIYDFQILFGGILAFGAGVFVWIAARVHIDYEKEKDREIKEKYRIYYARLAETIANQTELKNKQFVSTFPSQSVTLLFDKFPDHFIITQEHIRYFNKEEISIISELERFLTFSNELVENILNWAAQNPDTPLNEKPTRVEKKTINGMSKIALKLSKSLDP